MTSSTSRHDGSPVRSDQIIAALDTIKILLLVIIEIIVAFIAVFTAVRTLRR